ncbi:MAG: hypothetical protein Q8O56_15160 [Solirubrobacteraceae bacterium]|nr:hypothetical protein [Solirubrobacteraceae bacterium]
MKGAQRAALVAALVGDLRSAGGWAGETHVQKTVFFLQELLRVPMGFAFQLYKYGPFSFDLSEQLGDMRGLGQLKLEPQRPPYGPKFAVADGAAQLETRFPKTRSKYRPQLDFIVEQLSSAGVGQLERLATALLVESELPNASLDARVSSLCTYKPHIDTDQARDAFAEVDAMRQQAKHLSLIAE